MEAGEIHQPPDGPSKGLAGLRPHPGFVQLEDETAKNTIATGCWHFDRLKMCHLTEHCEPCGWQGLATVAPAGYYGTLVPAPPAPPNTWVDKSGVSGKFRRPEDQLSCDAIGRQAFCCTSNKELHHLVRLPGLLTCPDDGASAWHQPFLLHLSTHHHRM